MCSKHSSSQNWIITPNTTLKTLVFRRGWVDQLYHSSFSSMARGVAILIHKSVPFSMTMSYQTQMGTLLSSQVKLECWQMCMVQTGTMRVFSLPDLNYHQLILGGDFNCCFDPLLDWSSNKPSVPFKPSKANFWPISNLPFLSKILEKAVANQLCNFYSLLDWIIGFSGFRAHHSTETALVKLPLNFIRQWTSHCPCPVRP